MASSVNTSMHAVRGFFRFAHIDGLIPSDPAVYARLPKIESDESPTQGLDPLEFMRFLQVAQTITVHHGALAYLLGINALRASSRPRSGSRTTKTRCAATESCIWLGRATSPPCRSPCQFSASWRPVGDNARPVDWCSGHCRASRSIGEMPTTTDVGLPSQCRVAASSSPATASATGMAHHRLRGTSYCSPSNRRGGDVTARAPLRD
jgi:hypothetical protein